MKLSQLYIYPIKSLPPLAVSSAKISTHGFEYDRQFMLIRLKTDGSIQNMTIKETSELCLFKLELTPTGDSITVKSLPPLLLLSPAVQGSSSPPASPSSSSSSEKFTFTHLPNETITIPLTPSHTQFKSAKPYQITIYESTAKAWDMGDTYASFFTRCLTNNNAISGDDGEIRLIYTGPDEGRFTDAILTPSSRREPSKSSSNPMMQIPWLKKNSNNSTSTSTKGQKIAFSDAAPMLVVTTKSLEDVRNRLPEREREGIDMVLFRPNLVVENRAEGGVRGEAYDEEFWAGVEIFNDQLQGDDKEETGQKRVWLEMTFNTVRCQSINIDLQTGRQKPSDQQIYKKLMKDRRINPYFKYKPCFGKYALCNQYGATVSIGDEVVVVKRNEERHVPVV